VDPKLSAEKYRARALELRTLALQSKMEEVRHELMSLAANYELLAERVEKLPHRP